MESGLELDALIAERVMGWTRMSYAQQYADNPNFKNRTDLTTCWHAPDGEEKARAEDCQDYYRPEDAWSPSTDIAAAWSILSAGKLGTTEIHGPWTDEQGGQEWRIPDQTGSGFTRANSAPLAICLAALRACGVEYESTT